VRRTRNTESQKGHARVFGLAAGDSVY